MMKDLRILFTMCALLLLAVPVQAYDFKVDGIKSTYAATKYWSNFQQIKEGDFDLSISTAPTESVHIAKTSHGFQITGVAAGQRVTVYRADGTLLLQLKSTGHTLSVPLTIHQVYLIQTGDTTHKVAF